MNYGSVPTSRSLILQPYEQLEQEWGRFNGLDPTGMVACASGTAALHLALEALQLPPRSEVLVPDFNMIAVPRAVTLAGLTPVFVDCHSEDLLIDENLLTVNLRSQIKPSAVMVVHIYGRRCRIDGSIVDFVGSNTKLIEDSAEAHGVKPHPRTDAMCTSFYKNKIVAGEEGGAVWFKDRKHADLARQLRSLGFTDKHDFNHVPRGHNYRMSNLHAERILDPANYNGLAWMTEKSSFHGSKIERGNIAMRREVESWYDAACPPEWKMPYRDAPWVYDIRIPGMTSEQQDRVVAAVQAAGIPMRHGFKPMSLQQEYRGCRQITSGISRAVIASSQVVYLPIRPGVDDRESARLAFETIRSVVG